MIFLTVGELYVVNEFRGRHLRPPLKSAGLQALCLGTRCGAGMDNMHNTLASCIVEGCSARLFEALIRVRCAK